MALGLRRGVNRRCDLAPLAFLISLYEIDVSWREHRVGRRMLSSSTLSECAFEQPVTRQRCLRRRKLKGTAEVSVIPQNVHVGPSKRREGAMVDENPMQPEIDDPGMLLPMTGPTVGVINVDRRLLSGFPHSGRRRRPSAYSKADPDRVEPTCRSARFRNDETRRLRGGVLIRGSAQRTIGDRHATSVMAGPHGLVVPAQPMVYGNRAPDRQVHCPPSVAFVPWDGARSGGGRPAGAYSLPGGCQRTWDLWFM